MRNDTVSEWCVMRVTETCDAPSMIGLLAAGKGTPPTEWNKEPFDVAGEIQLHQDNAEFGSSEYIRLFVKR